MANHTGSEGTVRVGANAVAEIKGWSLDVKGTTIDDTELGDSWKTKKAGTKEWSGSVDCHWDETNTTGQGALDAGVEVTLNLYPEGATSGDTYWTGSAIIVGTTYKGSIDGMVEATYSFEGNGALTETTVV